MGKYDRKAQSQPKHGPSSVSSASKAPAPPPRIRPGWTGPSYIKKQSKKGNAAPTANNLQTGPTQTIQEHLLPVQVQQLMLDIFRDTFEASQDFDALKPLLQKINSALGQKDYASISKSAEALEAYAIRWSPSRALALSSVLAWVCETHQDDEWVQRLLFLNNKEQKPIKAISLGGGPTELVAFAGFLRHKRKGAAGKPGATTMNVSHDQKFPETAFQLHLLDLCAWSSVISKLELGLITPPTLSKYASESARSANASFLASGAQATTFVQADILDMSTEDIHALVGSSPILVTVFFTLHDLYSTSIPKTTSFLRNLSTVSPKETLLLVVERQGASVSLSSTRNEEGGKGEYPVSWLLKNSLTPSVKEEEDDNTIVSVPLIMWEKLIEDENRQYRLPEKVLRYPASLENLKIQTHLFKRI